MLIGLSLSSCIRDICEGKVAKDDVQLLVTGTCIKDEAGFIRCCEHYCEVQWEQFPEEAKRIAREFWERGLIIQPRLQYPEIHHYVGAGHWAIITYL